MLKVFNLSKKYDSITVLSNISFSLGSGQKAALVGHNGTGKTTLLKIIAGIEEKDGGKIEIGQQVRIGYLPQDTSLSGDQTIIDYLKSITGLDDLEKKIETLSYQLEDPEKLNQYSQVYEEYEHAQGHTFENRARIILTGFGLDSVKLNQCLSELSSGQKSKVALAGILLKGVDLLLLDEPTNNLDLPALIWLEDFLQKSTASCLIVSHDRKFLDRIVKKIFRIDWQTRSLDVTNGTYSDYLIQLEKNLTRQKEEYRIQQEEIERLNERVKERKNESAKGSNWTGSDNDKFLRGFKRDRAGKSSKVAKAIEKRIEHLDKIEKPSERKPFEISLQVITDFGNLNIALKDVVIGYADNFQIGPLSLDINYGNRLGIMGLNGSGKSTLLKTITGKLKPLQGELVIGSGIKVGNMMQEHETLPRDVTLLNFLMQEAKLSRSDSYANLVRFGFDNRQAESEISILSPGGRARLLLAYFAALSVNTLVLDEPTNHLDIEALEALEETLTSYNGTVILVSHDRYFLEKANLDLTYVLADGILTRIPDYKAYVKSAEDVAQKLLKLL